MFQKLFLPSSLLIVSFLTIGCGDDNSSSSSLGNAGSVNKNVLIENVLVQGTCLEKHQITSANYVGAIRVFKNKENGKVNIWGILTRKGNRLEWLAMDKNNPGAYVPPITIGIGKSFDNQIEIKQDDIKDDTFKINTMSRPLGNKGDPNYRKPEVAVCQLKVFKRVDYLPTRNPGLSWDEYFKYQER